MSNINFALVDVDGNVRRIGSCPADQLAGQARGNLSPIEAPADVLDPRLWRYEDGAFVAVEPEAPSLESLKQAAWAIVREDRDRRISGGCETPLGRVDTDADSRGLIAGAVQMAMLSQMLSQPYSVDWSMEDNTVATHSAAQMITMGLTVGGYVEDCHARGRAIRGAIDAAADEAELAAIDTESNWPY